MNSLKNTKQAAKKGGNKATTRGDHEVVNVGGRLIPVLGTVGGTREESMQTARNIEAFLAERSTSNFKPQ